MLVNRSELDRKFDTEESDDGLIHLIYETALDNSLWPEMIVKAYRALETFESDQDSEQFHDLQTHLVRGLQISEREIQLREENQINMQLIRGLALRCQMFDAKGRLIHRTGTAAPRSPTTLPRELRSLASIRGRVALQPGPGHVSQPRNRDALGRASVLLGPDWTARIGLPRRVHWALMEFDDRPLKMVRQLGRNYGLPDSRVRLLEAFVHHANLRAAADHLGLTYETARTYMKDLCQSIGVSGQTELLRKVLLNPVARFTAATDQGESGQLRRTVTRPDGGVIEYFALGDDDAYPIIHFDALTGGALDVLAHPERIAPLLGRLGARLIVPCRAGTFRSSFIKQGAATDYGEDVRLICDHLGIDRFSILAYSYGSVAALGTAFVLSERVDRVTLASVCNPDYLEKNWAEMDFFYQISRVIGRRWPGILRRVVPFLCKSILQNIDNFSDKAAARAQCPQDRALLRDPVIRERSRAMLEERVAQGMDGLIQEYQIAARPLDFRLSDLQVPLHLFHGLQDSIHPLGGAEALATAAPRSTLTRLDGRGHNFIYAEWDWLLMDAVGLDYLIPDRARQELLLNSAA